MRPGREYQVAATSTPGAKVWASSSAEAVGAYLKAFRPAPGSNVILRPVDEHQAAELFAVTQQGPRRLQPGGRP